MKISIRLLKHITINKINHDDKKLLYIFLQQGDNN